VQGVGAGISETAVLEGAGQERFGNMGRTCISSVVMGVLLLGCDVEPAPNRPGPVAVPRPPAPGPNVAETDGPTPDVSRPTVDQKSTGPKYRYVPVRQVKPGSTLFAYLETSDRVPIAADLFALAELRKSAHANDSAGYVELRRASRVFSIPNGTAVKVLQFDRGSAAYEVRVLDGVHEGRSGWTSATLLWGRAEVAQKAASRQKAPATPAEKPDQPETADLQASRHRDSLMRMGKALERSNPKAAVENYREVVKEFPDTPEAKAAAERIKALTRSP
jgi:hypothetical protein